MIVQTDNWPRVHFGKVLSVKKEPIGLVFVEFDLDFGVKGQRLVNIEGIDPRVPPKHLSRAQHGLILILGGKHIVARTQGVPSHTVARVFVNERIEANEANKHLRTRPYLFDEPMLDVALTFREFVSNSYSIDWMHAVLGRKRK